MQLSQSTSMRMEQRQLLTPRMIQSMEILQLPLMALEERIEQELQANPVLEMHEQGEDGEEVLTPSVIDEPRKTEDFSEEERALVVKEDTGQSEDFERLARISDYLENEEFSTNSGNFRQQSSYDGERDKKLDAMNNTAARSGTLVEHLLDQWTFVEASPPIKRAGAAII